jgi:elongation factor G
MSNENEIVKKFREISLENYRNFGIAAHIDSGKTTLTERILFYTGRIHKMNEIRSEAGAVMDSMVQEKKRGITIQSAAITCIWDAHRFNIIDTPGHVDFTIEVLRSMRILNAAIMAYDSVAGVEPQSETVFRQANEYNLSRICFINKMDRQGANFYRCVEQIRSRLTPNAVILGLPVGIENEFNGVIDVLTREYIKWSGSTDGTVYERMQIPDSMVKEVETVRKDTVERIASLDDELITKFLSGEDISVSDLKKSLRNSVIKNKLVPVTCGSALKNVGVQFLLDMVNDYLPSPLDCGNTYGTLVDKKTKATSRVLVNLDRKDHLSALIFKTQAKKNLGNVAYISIYSGTIRKGSTVFNSVQGINERISRIVVVDSDSFYDVDEGYAGEVLAILFRERVSRTGDTICDMDYPLVLDNIIAPAPVISMSIEAEDKKATLALTEALRNLAFDDPSLHYSMKDRQLLISGMGELHLIITSERLQTEYNIKTTLGKPKVSYMITARNKLEKTYIHKKQTGGAGEFAKMVLTITPKERGSGLTFTNSVKNGSIPTEYIIPIEEGIKEAAKAGIDGCEIVDVDCNVSDGDFHPVDSNSNVFKRTAYYSFIDLVKEAKAVYLEPIMRVVVIFPQDYYGSVSSDISKRRGVIFDTTNDAFRSYCTIYAHIPLANMSGYVDDLRSITKGYGQYSMEFSHYAEVPDALVSQLSPA